MSDLQQAALNVAAQQLDLLQSLTTEELTTQQLLKQFKLIKKHINRNRDIEELASVNSQLYSLLASTYTTINERIVMLEADANDILTFGDLLGDVSRDLLERHHQQQALPETIDEELQKYL